MLIKPNILAVAETERQPEAAIDIWVKVFNNGPSKICGGQPLKFCSDMVCSDHITSNLLKVVFHKF